LSSKQVVRQVFEGGFSKSPLLFLSPHPVPLPSGERIKVRGNEHPHSPSKKGWQAKPDGVVADTPLREGN